MEHQEIAEQIFTFMKETAGDVKPTFADKWILSSIMQKALRRGDVDIALSAGKGLWLADRNNFWRRIHVAACEDIGIGDLEAVTTCLKVFQAKSFRDKPWDIAAGLFLVRLLCQSVKSRSADELYLKVERCPSLRKERAAMAVMSDGELQAVLSGECPLEHKALALWLLAGTQRFASDFLPRRKGDHQAVLSAISGIVCETKLKEACLSVLYKTQWPLALFTPLIAQEAAKDNGQHIITESVPLIQTVENVPLYAIDTYTRGGKLCIRLLMNEVKPLEVFSTAQVGMAIFYMEGVKTERTLSSPWLDEIRQSSELAMMCSLGLEPPEYLGLRDILKKQFGLLNNIREKQVTRHIQDLKGGLL